MQLNKKLQYVYCPISQEVNVTRQLYMVSSLNITWEILFLENHTQKGVSDPSIKNQNWAYIFESTVWNVIQLVSIVYPCRGQPKCIKTKVHLLLSYIKHFYKTKRSLQLLSLLQILHDFVEKYFSRYILLTDQISFSVCLISSWDIGQYVYCNYLFPSLWCQKFWN